MMSFTRLWAPNETRQPQDAGPGKQRGDLDERVQRQQERHDQDHRPGPTLRSSWAIVWPRFSRAVSVVSSPSSTARRIRRAMALMIRLKAQAASQMTATVTALRDQDVGLDIEELREALDDVAERKQVGQDGRFLG